MAERDGGKRGNGGKIGIVAAILALLAGAVLGLLGFAEVMPKFLGDALSAQTEVRDVAVLSQDNGENGKILRAEVQLRSILTSTQEQKTQALTDVFTLEGENVAVEKQPSALARSGVL